MMDDAAVFSVLSKCFGSVEKDEWKQMTRSAAWAEFMDGVRRLLQDDTRFGKQATPIERMHVRAPMQEFLSANEVDELFCLRFSMRSRVLRRVTSPEGFPSRRFPWNRCTRIGTLPTT
mgnify:CR=1 FL=1